MFRFTDVPEAFIGERLLYLNRFICTHFIQVSGEIAVHRTWVLFKWHNKYVPFH